MSGAERVKGVAEGSGYVPVVVDRLKMIALLMDRVGGVGDHSEGEVELARDVWRVLDESRHLQNEDGWRRMGDVLGEWYGLDKVEVFDRG